jgi:hypothetical protein
MHGIFSVDSPISAMVDKLRVDSTLSALMILLMFTPG